MNGESAGRGEEEQRGGRRRLPKLKIWKNRKHQNQNQNQIHSQEGELDCEEALQEKEEQLEEVSRRLIDREEQLFSQDSPAEEEEDQLQREFEALRVQILLAVENTFTSSSSSSSCSGQLEALRSAVASIQQQEAQDRRWTGSPETRVPVWRPQRCLSFHNDVLHNMVASRLKETAEDGQTDGLSSPLKREVCGMGKRVKEDLLTVARVVKDCYPPHMDILNLYAGLYHRSFSARLTELAAAGLELDDCSYLLFWINHCYPHEILNHEDLQGKIKTACLGSLLLQDPLTRLEDQYLTDKEDKVKRWLSAALKKEEQSWLSGRKPELIEQYCFSPLAIDVIQVMDGSLTELSCVIRDQRSGERISAHLDTFLCSYRKCVEEFVKGNHGDVRSVIKAQLVCEQQFRDYITGLTGSVSEQQRRRCLDSLSALLDCGHRCFIGPVHVQVKVCLRHLWTSAWLDGSLPVTDSLLDNLSEQLSDLTDLKPTCRQALLCALHQDVVVQYVKKMLRTRTKSREQQVDGAQRIIDDARKINDFFKDGGCSGSLWLCEMLCSLAEILRLQDPGSVQLEMVSVARRFPDLSDAHVAALLSLKSGLSAADIRSIRRSVEENRHDVSTNDSHPFFSKIKVKWINNKINQMGIKP